MFAINQFQPQIALLHHRAIHEIELVNRTSLHNVEYQLQVTVGADNFFFTPRRRTRKNTCQSGNKQMFYGFHRIY